MCYLWENFVFLFYLCTKFPEGLTQFGKSKLDATVTDANGELRPCRFYTKNRKAFEDILQNCNLAPVLQLEILTPEVYMKYCTTLRNKKTQTYQSKLSIGVKRSALFHLYRLHNGQGFSPGLIFQ
jgi:hypothetical protein